jgi:hypothetical protein
MEYTYKEPPEQHNGEKWFGHVIELIVLEARLDEFKAFLQEQFGPIGNRWRLRYNPPAFVSRTFTWKIPNSKEVVRFAHKSDAMLFKIVWEEDEDPMVTIMASIKNLTRNINLHTMRPASYPISHVSPIYPYHHLPIMPLKSVAIPQNPCGEITISEKRYLNYLYGSLKESKCSGIKVLKHRGHSVLSEDEFKARMDYDNKPDSDS